MVRFDRRSWHGLSLHISEPRPVGNLADAAAWCLSSRLEYSLEGMMLKRIVSRQRTFSNLQLLYEGLTKSETDAKCSV